jgi:uncharacterized small protein (DUF1192 family)
MRPENTLVVAEVDQRVALLHAEAGQAHLLQPQDARDRAT